jgi:hypothetical protein
MRKGTDLIGKPIIDYECGSQLATNRAGPSGAIDGLQP